MLVPIESHRLAALPTSFVFQAHPEAELEESIARCDLDRSSSHFWIHAARRLPHLATCLIQVAGPSTHAGAGAAGILREWASRPDWMSLASQLTSAGDLDESVALDRIRLARLAALVARETAWCAIEEAYWHALAESSPPRPAQHGEELDFVEARERCRIVARWSLDARQDDGPRPGTEAILSPREAVKALATLDGAVDVDELFRELDCSLDEPEVPWDVPTRRRLASLARLAGYRQETRWHDQLHQLVSLLEPSEVLRCVIRLVRAWAPGSVGLWIPRRDAVAGEFLGIMVGELDPSLSAEGTREAIEASALPPLLRSSRPLLTTEGSLVGWVYSDRPIAGCLVDRWLPRLAMSLSACFDRWESRRAEVARRDAGRALARRREMDQRQLRRAIGEFSAGAGHEINNPLGAITGHAQRLLKNETDPAKRHALEQIKEQVGRIRRMIKDLQLIGGTYPVAREPVPLAELLITAAREAEKRLSTGRRVFRSCEPDWHVIGDAKLLTRMITELVVNGAEAAGTKGEVRVWCERASEQPPMIELVVADSGPGLSRHERERAFLPFYSGREAGRGLGMGLPVADRIALEHGGEIVIGYGRPTVVRVQLPAA